MADLPEADGFVAGVTQIETNEPVLGGLNGVSNRALKQLASRTRWLKDQYDGFLASIANLYAEKDGDYSTLRARATTKEDVGLGDVPNYPATSAVDQDDPAKFATARAVKTAHDAAVAAAAAAAGAAVIATFESAPIAIVPRALNSVAHLLGAKPSIVTAGLVCSTAEYGYVAGDEMLISLSPVNSGARGATILPDDTNIRVQLGASGNVFQCHQVGGANAGDAANLTNANWTLVIHATLIS